MIKKNIPKMLLCLTYVLCFDLKTAVFPFVFCMQLLNEN